MTAGRRETLRTLGLGAGMAMLAASRPDATAAAEHGEVTAPEGGQLRGLGDRLAQAPRRRDFKAVPMILDHPELWDHEALSEVLAYAPEPRQAWDNADVGGPWLNLMRNAMNTEVWSFRHPDFLVVSATHGTANLALYDQSMWDKYDLPKLAGEKFKANTLINEQPSQRAALAGHQDPAGPFSPAGNTIPALMRRGVLFLSCHNTIWEHAASLAKAGSNPDKLPHEVLAAELTNHLVPGVILIPGAVGTLLELQRAGFHYAK